MKTYLMCCCLFFVGCGNPHPPRQVKPDRVSADTLVMSFRNRPPVYHGRVVQVHLTAGSWRNHRTHIAAGVCGADDAIRFELPSPAAPQAGCSLLITGTCAGMVRDGRLRCGNPEFDWFVRVEQCTVTELWP